VDTQRELAMPLAAAEVTLTIADLLHPLFIHPKIELHLLLDCGYGGLLEVKRWLDQSAKSRSPIPVGFLPLLMLQTVGESLLVVVFHLTGKSP
jgi:hypothetical protein